MKEALYYEKLKDKTTQCHLCPNECLIKNEKAGKCLNRKNIDGTLYSLNYGRISSVALDPIEKKPLYHFYPGSGILSFGTTGCSLKCDFCQNCQISMSGPEHTEPMTPQECIRLALERQQKLVAYTYNEPYIWFEHVLECSILARENGLKNVLVTNGFYNPEPFLELLQYTDAMNIDLKAFSNEFYKKYCFAELNPVLETIRTAYGKTVIEITTLIIPGLNDSEEEIEKLVNFIAEIDVEIPFHISRYFPRHKRIDPPTGEAVLRRIEKQAKKQLKHVYVGNAAGFDSHTYCAQCGEILINRETFSSKKRHLNNGKCSQCGKTLYGAF